jgi:L-malate glycosyltransferase
VKILYFSQDYTTHDYRFLEKISRSSYEVYYLRLETNPNPYEKRALPEKVKVVNWRGNSSFKLGLLGKINLFYDFRKIINEINPDIIHAGPIQSCGFYTALASFHPFLLMSWGSDIMVVPDRNLFNKLITKYTIKKADNMVCDCLSVKDKIIHLFSYPDKKIAVFPWGIDLDKFHPRRSRLNIREKLDWFNNKIIISTRSFEQIYGTMTFFNAAKAVLDKESNVRFIVLGAGSLEGKIQRFIEYHHITHAFHIPGRIQYDFLPDYFNEGDVYVSCSLSDGTSVSLLEAMACRLPVVVSDLPANREWVIPKVNGWLCKPGDDCSFSSALLEAVESSLDTQRIGQNNYNLAQQKANWEQNSDILFNIYDGLTGRN